MCVRVCVCVQDFEGEEGTDVYYCEYQYDEQWKVRVCVCVCVCA